MMTEIRSEPTEGMPRRRPRANPRRVTVRAVAPLSPLMRRITFEGSDLATFAWSGPAAHIKVVFPDPDSGILPEVTPDGPRPATVRTYTPRRFDPVAGTLDVDFVLHGAGPASTWAAHAQAGQELIILGPGPGYAIDADVDWYVLAGDEAALPAIETILEGIAPSVRVTALLEVGSMAEVRDLPGARDADLRWLPRADAAHASPSPLLSALDAFAWPAGNGRVYVGCEADEVRRIRAAVVERSGLDRAAIVTRGYWRIGAVDHPDHDYARD